MEVEVEEVTEEAEEVVAQRIFINFWSSVMSLDSYHWILDYQNSSINANLNVDMWLFIYVVLKVVTRMEQEALEVEDKLLIIVIFFFF